MTLENKMFQLKSQKFYMKFDGIGDPYKQVA